MYLALKVKKLKKTVYIKMNIAYQQADDKVQLGEGNKERMPMKKTMKFNSHKKRSF